MRKSENAPPNKEILPKGEPISLGTLKDTDNYEASSWRKQLSLRETRRLTHASKQAGRW